MFKYYNKDTVTEVGGNLRIIGDQSSRLCLLKDNNGPLYAGRFHDCEYVAATITEVEHGCTVELFFNRCYAPCSAEDAVRAVRSTGADGLYVIWVRYKHESSRKQTFEACLRELLNCWSPYEILKYDKDGILTIDRYNSLEVHDMRTSTGLAVGFTHGIHVLHDGLIIDCHRSIGGFIGKKFKGEEHDQDGPYEHTMRENSNWAWNIYGKCSIHDMPVRDPEQLATGVYAGREELELDGDADELLSIAKNRTDPGAYVDACRERTKEMYSEECMDVPPAVLKMYDVMYKKATAQIV